MKKILSLTLIAFMVLSSCSKKGNEVKLVNKNFGNELAMDQAMEFTFDKALVPDSVVGTWTDLEYITFQPEIPGRYHWESKSKLVFMPKNGLRPATNYQATISQNILKHNPTLALAGQTKFQFHSPFAEMVSSRAYWRYDENTNEQGIWLEMNFNYPVNPSEVSKLLDVEIADASIDPKLVSGENSKTIHMMVTDIDRKDMQYPVSIRLDKGLVPMGGSSRSKEAYSNQFTIPSPQELEITEIQTTHDGMEGTLNLYTSQQVVKENIRNYISISPSVNYSVEVEPGYILITSEYFDVDKEYKITIKEGLGGTLGGKLKYEYNQPVTFGEVEPTIKFADSKEFYVSGSGSRNIQVAILNVPKVNVQVTKIYENNIISYMSNSYSNYYYDYEYDEYYYSSPNVGNLGDVVYEEEIETRTLPKKGSNRVLTLDFEDKLKDNKGIYVIEIKSADDYYPRASKMLSISDIGLIVKDGQKQVMVFANSIKTAKPLANIEVSFIGRNNQLTQRLTTDKNGVAVFEYSSLKAPGFETTMVTARLGDDFNMIPLDKTRINTSRFDVGGKYPNPSGMEAFVYAERDLYRPGEKVNISTIVRNAKWESPGELPVIMKFVAPNGKVFKTIRKTLNQYGSFEAGIDLPSSAQTGSYIANIYSGNEILIGSKVIKVEEFMPDRIKVKVNIDKEEYKPGEQFFIDVEAVNFFGPPAANRNFEVQLTTNRLGFYPKKYRGYNFYIQGARTSFSNVLRQDVTDSEGKGQLSLTVPEVYKDMGILSTDVFVTVFDETGRPVNRLSNFKIITQDVFYGIRNPDYYVKTNQPVNVDIIALDKDENALKDVEAHVKLIRYEYKTVVSKSGKYYRYRSEKIEHVLEDKTIKLYGTATNFGFVPEFSGEYEIRVSAPGVNTFVNERLYAYGWGSTSYGSFKVDNEGQIEIETDKESYHVGEKANIILKAPFSGKILLTLETDKVIDYYYLETDKRAASISIEMKDEYLPNVYIGACLFRPHEVSDIPLTVAHGYTSLKVENPVNKIPLTITAVKKSRSNMQQKIKVTGKPNSALTLAVVDEGILQVAGMSTPDAYEFFYRKRALQVATSNVYPYLFPELGMLSSHTGGDGGSMADRLNPIQNKRVKLVSYWSGILETNSKGEAEYTIDIPQFSGDLRIMALSYNGKAFGSAQENMKVADPLVTSVALPRFLSPGDHVQMPVTLT
ncbi:MAG: hypothetical protein JW801_16150, partial [Bacteroidales bacterium]|nr:hypothetical protein [Bacteroidales bacterium]